MKNHTSICAAIIILFSSYALAGTKQIINYPGATNTYATGIDGGKVVGFYSDSSGNSHGFIYDGTNWTPINKAGVTNLEISGIDGSNLIGTYDDSDGSHAFLYDGSTWTTIFSTLNTFPGPMWSPRSISGNNIVGNNNSYGSNLMVMYNIPTTTFSMLTQSAAWTAEGIEGDNIVGVYLVFSSSERTFIHHGFLYDGSTWNLLDVPGASRTDAYAIDGGNIIGTCQIGSSYYSFLYNGSSWTTFSFLSGMQDMEGDKIVGFSSNGNTVQSYIYTIPEPCTLLLLGLGAAGFIRRR